MKRASSAFTLSELLVVLGITVVLAAILMPVLLSAKAAAEKAVCLSNLKQASLAMQEYLGDYDLKYTPVNYEPGQKPDPVNDRTWVQLLLPYVRSFDIFRDPGDYGARDKDDSSFNEGVFSDDAYARYYMESLRSDIGFNYLYLAPVQEEEGRWVSEPRFETQFQPSSTILYVDSVWARNGSGTPYGGGDWLVVPPCRWSFQNGEKIDTFVDGGNNATNVFAVTNGWSAENNSSNQYGHAWPWHSGRMNVAFLDSSVKSVTPEQLGTGCNVQPQWKGFIQDPSQYMWAQRQ